MATSLTCALQSTGKTRCHGSKELAVNSPIVIHPPVTAGEENLPHSSASRSSVEERFKVHDTPTRADPLHKTMELPKPLTPQEAKTFNRLFGRGGGGRIIKP
jgi:hypothetical protein